MRLTTTLIYYFLMSVSGALFLFVSFACVLLLVHVCCQVAVLLIYLYFIYYIKYWTHLKLARKVKGSWKLGIIILWVPGIGIYVPNSISIPPTVVEIFQSESRWYFQS